MFEHLMKNPDWRDALAVQAEAAHREIERMTDDALIALGIPESTVNRRRGQLRHHRKEKE